MSLKVAELNNKGIVPPDPLHRKAIFPEDEEHTNRNVESLTTGSFQNQLSKRSTNPPFGYTSTMQSFKS